MNSFRFHRGSLEESLKTSQKINGIKDLYNIIEQYGIKVESLNINFYAYDSRLKEDTYIVVVNDGVLGFINTKIGGIKKCYLTMEY